MECSATFFHSTSAAQDETSPLRPVAITLKGVATEIQQATHIIFLLDISESMDEPCGDHHSSQSKLKTVKRSIDFILPLLTPRDMVSLITFGEDSEIHLKAEQISEVGRANIQHKVTALRTKGCTNMSAGLLDVQRALDEMNARDYPAHKHGVFLLTDGLANRGQTKPDQLLSIVQKIQIYYPALTFSTFGYGKDHNANLLKDIATTGGGSYNVVYSLEDVATTFGEVLGGLTSVVAQNVKVILSAGSEPMTGYALETSASSGEAPLTTVKVGDVYAENEVIVLANIPRDTPHIKVSWTDMRDISFQDTNLQICPAEPTAPKPIQIALFRYKVAEILKKLPTLPFTQVAETRLAVQNLLDQLLSLPYAEEVIVKMLVDDLRTVLEGFDRGISQERATEVTQHAAYLSMGRGLRCSAPAASATAVNPTYLSDSEEELDDPAGAATPIRGGWRLGRGRRGGVWHGRTQGPRGTFATPALSALASFPLPAAAAEAQGAASAQVSSYTPPRPTFEYASSPFSNPNQRRFTQHIRETLSQQSDAQEPQSQQPPS